MVDSEGNVYVADGGNNCIRKITSAGVVTTFAGSTTQGSSDGTGTNATFTIPFSTALDSSGNIYVAEGYGHRIRKITSAGVVTTLAGSGNAQFADGTGTNASFTYPFGVTVDSAGNVYVADSFGHRIRKITSAGVVTNLAGDGSAGSTDGTGASARFNTPWHITIDSNGNLYVPEYSGHRIRRITPVSYTHLTLPTKRIV